MDVQPLGVKLENLVFDWPCQIIFTLMRTAFVLILLVFALFSQAQTVFTVNNFSPDYYGKISISDTSEVFSKGWIAIFDKKANRQLIKVEAEELALSLHDGKALANIKELPYGEQSLILHEDYNFDGVKDFAIEDGQNSCYHGPSFQVFLGSKNGFTPSKSFTRLAQEYCGMFEVDAKNKRISTMTKDGCCWHQFSEFLVENNHPKAVKIVEEDGKDFPYSISSVETWNGTKMVKASSRTIDLKAEGIETVLSFTLEKNGKTAVLFNINDRTLNYALLQKNGEVEFSYPIEIVYQNPDFKVQTSTAGNKAIFKNKDASYEIYESSASVGVKVILKGTTYDFKGIAGSKKGSLNGLLKTRLDNVVMY